MNKENKQNEDNNHFEYVFGENVEKEYPDVSISIERITPQLAEEWLKANVDNRNKKRESISKALRNGEWLLNGASIVFSRDGILRDGQNRLYAIVETEIAADSIIVRGVESQSQITMDSGIKRTVADFLKMQGYKNPNIVGSVGLALYRLDANGLESAFYVGTTYQTTTMGVVNYINQIYQDRIEPIYRQAENMARRFKCLRSGTVAPLLDEFRKTGDDNMNEFVNQFCGWSVRSQPVQILTNRLTAVDKDKTATLQQSTIAALIIKAWNAFMQGEEIHCLRYTKGGAHPETFPKIYGLDYSNE